MSVLMIWSPLAMLLPQEPAERMTPFISRRQAFPAMRSAPQKKLSSQRRATPTWFGSILVPLFLLSFHLISRPSSLKPKLSATSFS
jgi:hypothetical protein